MRLIGSLGPSQPQPWQADLLLGQHPAGEEGGSGTGGGVGREEQVLTPPVMAAFGKSLSSSKQRMTTGKCQTALKFLFLLFFFSQY